ncbi:MAG TPA: hypothetical protein VGR06_07625 [Actinophytocola sp.]|jgi:hypothetical protein|uniref:hypothetical protein n=1 Tax=Actinophytocola sp. TaxID=1872138 RepID=UPI002DFA24E6|nr:hypothetical protein [Actinophytocola sp.]
MRGALSTCLPDPEPPIGLDLEHIMRQGRRRQRVHRAIPLAAAAVTVLTVAVPWSFGSTGPASGGTLPVLGGSPSASIAMTSPAPPLAAVPPNQQTATVPPAQDPPPGTPAPSGTPSTAQPPPAQPAHRAPAGHAQDKDGDALAKTIVDRLPAGRTADYFGTRSATMVGARYGWGFHILWQDSGRYGYLMWLHRTKGAFPATIYGLPAEPCAELADRLPSYHCAPVTVSNGTATSFDVDTGDHRMRGIVWDQKDSAGGADMRVTVAFTLPAPGAWTPFSMLDTAPRLDTIPMSIQDMAKLMGIN